MAEISIVLTTTREIAGHAQAGITRHMNHLVRCAAQIRLHPSGDDVLAKAFGHDDAADLTALQAEWLACYAACRTLGGLPPQFDDLAASAWLNDVQLAMSEIAQE